jgi:hypothetical protein
MRIRRTQSSPIGLAAASIAQRGFIALTMTEAAIA